MGHCYHHALSSVKKWGGAAEDYMPLYPAHVRTRKSFGLMIRKLSVTRSQ